VHRRAQFHPWSEEALGSYLDDLRRAKERGTISCAKNTPACRGSCRPRPAARVLEEIVRLKMAWQRAMFLSHPAVMSGARPLTDEGTQAQMTSFETYARGELETYSERTLELLHRDLLAMQARGRACRRWFTTTWCGRAVTNRWRRPKRK